MVTSHLDSGKRKTDTVAQGLLARFAPGDGRPAVRMASPEVKDPLQYLSNAKNKEDLEVRGLVPADIAAIARNFAQSSKGQISYAQANGILRQYFLSMSSATDEAAVEMIYHSTLSQLQKLYDKGQRVRDIQTIAAVKEVDELLSRRPAAPTTQSMAPTPEVVSIGDWSERDEPAETPAVKHDARPSHIAEAKAPLPQPQMSRAEFEALINTPTTTPAPVAKSIDQASDVELAAQSEVLKHLNKDNIDQLKQLRRKIEKNIANRTASGTQAAFGTAEPLISPEDVTTVGGSRITFEALQRESIRAKEEIASSLLRAAEIEARLQKTVRDTSTNRTEELRILVADLEHAYQAIEDLVNNPRVLELAA